MAVHVRVIFSTSESFLVGVRCGQDRPSECFVSLPGNWDLREMNEQTYQSKCYDMGSAQIGFRHPGVDITEAWRRLQIAHAEFGT